MKILIAPDSLKDCLTAIEVAQSLADGIRESLPGTEIHLFPTADGAKVLPAACIIIWVVNG